MGLLDESSPATARLSLGNVIPSIATLAYGPVSNGIRALSGPDLQGPLFVEGYYTPGDGGGGLFYWSASSTAADDGALTFAPLAGGIGRWLRLPSNITTSVSLIQWGVVPGSTDYTSRIDAAAAYAWANKLEVYAPAGSYIYNGSGAGGNAIRYRLRGDGRGQTVFVLGPSSYLISCSALISSTYVADLTISGGLGLFQHTYTGVNVQESHVFERCELKNYTQCGIYTMSQDMPYVRVIDCQFLAANDTSTMGFAHAGYCDSLYIAQSDFLKNTIGIKLKRGGNNAYIDCCDLLRWDAYSGTARVSLWVVPETLITNAGPGLTVRSSKFGNENLSPSDLPVVYADEDTSSGTDVSTYFPKYGTASTGYIDGHAFADNLCNNITNAPPFVFTTTPNVRACRFGSMTIEGGVPAYILKFLPSLLPLAGDYTTNTNLFGPFHGVGAGVTPGNTLQISNAIGMGAVTDPNAIILGADVPLAQLGGSRPTGYALALSSLATPFSTALAATTTPITDSQGGTDAITATLTGGYIYAYLASAALIANKPVWVEFDIQVAPSSPLSVVEMLVAQDTFGSGGPIHLRRQIVPSANWASRRFLWEPRTVGASILLAFQIPGGATGAQVNLGQVRVSSASEPVNVDMAIPGGGKVKTRHYTLTGVNLNSATTDVGTFNNLPAKYIVRRLTCFDASTNLTTATIDLRTATGGGGTALVSAQGLASCTAATKFEDVTLAAVAGTDYQTATPLTLRNVSAQGAPATASFRLEVVDVTP